MPACACATRRCLLIQNGKLFVNLFCNLPDEDDKEEALTQLMDLGFSREQCEQALKASGGNVDHAAALLFGG